MTDVYLEPKQPLSAEDVAAIRASSTSLCWKRAGDMPSHLRVEEGVCTNRAGNELWYSAVFPPSTAPLRGIVLFVHGVNEHSGRYFHVFQDLCAMGFGVLAYDLRSHGKTHMDLAQKRGHINKFDGFIEDTNDFLHFAKKEVCPKMLDGAYDVDAIPLVVLGFSLGTLVSIHTVLSAEHAFAAMILAAPCVNVEMTMVLRGLTAVGSMLVNVVPTARTVPGVNEKWVCHDPLVGKDYDADPLTVRAQLTTRTGHEIQRFMDKLSKDKSVEDAESVFGKLPILFIQGSLDKVTNLPMAQKFYERLANKDKQFIVIDDCYHVVFEDFERPRVVNEINQWLHARFPVLP